MFQKPLSLQTNHDWWKHKVREELKSQEIYNKAKEQANNFRLTRNMSELKDPFRSTNQGRLVYLDNDKCSSPQIVNKENKSFLAYYNQSGKMTHAYQINPNGLSRSFSPALIDIDTASTKSKIIKRSNSTQSNYSHKSVKSNDKNDTSSKKGYEGLMEIIKKSGTTESISSQFMNKVMNKIDDIDELVSNSNKANLIRELKAELEKQNSAKNQALHILKKLKKDDKE
eukprot:Mrub_10000.p1 GENE.Mrub_10000~~Mrub_10000.p1  ORF type:complete len:227 (-),score=42.67 Mrub_10000:31-711(-)